MRKNEIAERKLKFMKIMVDKGKKLWYDNGARKKTENFGGFENVNIYGKTC